MLNLTHLARTINSLIGGKIFQNKQNGGLTTTSLKSPQSGEGGCVLKTFYDLLT